MALLKYQMLLLGLQIALCIFQLWLSHKTNKEWQKMDELDKQRQKETADLINAYLKETENDKQI